MRKLSALLGMATLLVFASACGTKTKARTTTIAAPPARRAIRPAAKPATDQSKSRDAATTTEKPKPPASLHEVFTAEERNALTTHIQGALGRAEANLAKARARKLSSEQQREVGRVEGFIAQSRQTLSTGDLSGSRVLADKAEVLSGSLSQ